ncbi:hypothetical protein, partial [Caldivirga sp. MU80]|uniref:hypothetical protein n=1 Tax=Caldivirga sp. MU80 TaxID=1650354 RepID=UPI000B153B27
MSSKSGKYGITKLLPILAVALALTLLGVGHAVKAISLPGPPVPPTIVITNQTYTISLNLAYAQPPVTYVTGLNSTLLGMYHLLYDTVPAYYGIAGQTITFYIVNASDITYPNGTLVPGSYLSYFNTAISSDIGLLVGESFTVTTNSTGGFTYSFKLPISPSSLNYASFLAKWMVIVTLNYKGYQWVIFNFTTAPSLLGDVLGNLTTAASSPTTAYLETPSGGQYMIMVPVNGTTGQYYAMSMTGLNVVYIWFGLDLVTTAPAAMVSSSIWSDLALTFAEYYSGIPIIVNSSVPYNPTATQFSTGIYGVQYVAFGPFIYLPALIFQNGHLIGFAQSGSSNPVYFTINVTYSYYNPGTQGTVTVPVYSTTNYAFQGYYNNGLLLGGTLVGYDFFYDGFFNVTSLDGYGLGVVGPHSEGLPDLVIAGGLITIQAVNILDIKGNLLASSTYMFSPTASFLFEVTLGPQYSQILYGPLPISFLFQGFTIPAVQFTGTVYPPTSPTPIPISPHHMALSIELQTTSGTWDVAFLNLSALVNLAIQNNTPNVVIEDIYTSLLPVTFFVTQYTHGVPATSQEPVLVEKAEQLKAVLYAGPSITSLSPLATGQVVYLSESAFGIVGTVAVFPTLQVYHIVNGYLAQSPVVELPVPTFMGTFSSSLVTVSNGQLTVSSPVYYNTTATVYFNLQLYYGTIMVGSGVFSATYTYSTSGFAPAAVNSYLIEPVFQAYYANGANNTLYAVGPEKQIAVATGTILSETAYTAVQVMLYKVEFVNLCNQTLTQ